MTKPTVKITDQEALDLHSAYPPGKIGITVTKPLTTQRDMSLAYSPGVAVPCLEIAKDPAKAYDYTNKQNSVAVISEGSAVLGLGNLGALASKPVMEGKAALFKRFADIDAIDLEIDTQDVDEFVNCVRYLGPAFGGINLEDIKAPQCFMIEERLREVMDVPIFHDDQHGTAIITAAGILNALDITGRKLEETTFVFNGAGAASIACLELIKSMGLPDKNVYLCDSEGVIYKGRTTGMNPWKEKHAIETNKRSLDDAMDGADAFVGLSVKDAVSQSMVKSMAKNPIIFAMANPNPEIAPEKVWEVRDDAIVATGRSDYPNQVNNVLGFPYIFRGALDVQASTFNDDMKIAAAHALAQLARRDVPDVVAAAYSGRQLRYGPDYLIPVPFDPRLICEIPAAVAQAAMDSGVARKPIEDMRTYKKSLTERLDPTAAALRRIFDQVAAHPKRVVFAEGEEEKSIRAAVNFQSAGYGQAILVGREEHIAKTMESIGLRKVDGLVITNAKLSDRNQEYMDFVYKRLQRKGFLFRDCQRMVNHDRNVFAACMVEFGDADAMVTGLTRTYSATLKEILRVISAKPSHRVFGLTMVINKGRTVFLTDTSVHETPTPEQLVDISIQSAEKARLLGHEPRVALASFSNFGNPARVESTRMREAVKMLEARKVDFEFDGDIAADVALNPELLKLYPFSRLSATANVIVMPGLHSAHISSKLLQQLGGGTVIGPILIGLEKSAQIVPMGADVSDIVNSAVFAAHNAHDWSQETVGEDKPKAAARKKAG